MKEQTSPSTPSARFMQGHPAAADWAAARGEKWRAQLTRMEATLAPVDEPLIQALRLEAPGSIADLGCGGGGTTLEIARRAPAGSTVSGFDISPALIELARARGKSEKRTVSFALADVATATAPEKPYDRLVSRFGIMFFDDPPAAFARLLDWLAPGGRFAFAVWGPPVDNPWMTNIREVAAELIDVPTFDPAAPGPFRYAEPDRLLPLLEGAGFGGLAVSDWRGALPIGGELQPAEAADFALAAFSSFGELLAQAGDEAVEAARRSLSTRLSRYRRDGAVWMDARVHLFTGTRPH